MAWTQEELNLKGPNAKMQNEAQELQEIAQARAGGRNLMNKRTELGFTLEQVEEKTGNEIKKVWLSRLENGKLDRIDIDKCATLAELYNLDLTEFYKLLRPKQTP